MFSSKAEMREDILARNNFEECLEYVENGADLAPRIGWGFYDVDLHNLAMLYIKSDVSGDKEMKCKILDLLKDCNFHNASKDFREGHYDLYLISKSNVELYNTFLSDMKNEEARFDKLTDIIINNPDKFDEKLEEYGMTQIEDKEDLKMYIIEHREYYKRLKRVDFEIKGDNTSSVAMTLAHIDKKYNNLHSNVDTMRQRAEEKYKETQQKINTALEDENLDI